MCNPTGMSFGVQCLPEREIAGKRVLEVGARDFNGGVRGIFESFGPSEYVGVDLQEGPGVDVLCDVSNLAEHFGEESFDVVFNTELIEHVEHWRSGISNLKLVLRPEGIMVITTRSPGFKYHGFPYDFWRYRPEDLERIFADFEILELRPDPSAAGVFLKAKKPANFTETSLDDIELYSIITQKFEKTVSPSAIKKVQRNFRWRTGVRRRLIRPIDWTLRIAFPYEE